MSKIKIEIKLEKNNKQQLNLDTNAIITDNIIKYKEEKTINILDIKQEKLTRKTKDYKIIIDFKNEIIISKYNSYEIPIQIKITKKQIEKHNIQIEYEIIETKEKFKYKIIWR